MKKILNVFAGTFFMEFVLRLNKYTELLKLCMFKWKRNCFSSSPFFAGCPVKFNAQYRAIETKILFLSHTFFLIKKPWKSHNFQEQIIPIEVSHLQKLSRFYFLQSKDQAQQTSLHKCQLCYCKLKTLI